jgi:Bacterial regulatory helix-turn-helix protein, lysR family
MLEDLRSLVEFPHSGSIASAADRLFRTPSAITRQVQRLEAAVEGTASATCPDLTGSSDELRKDTNRLPWVDQELRDLILEDLAVDIGARRVKGSKIPVIPGGDANSRR